MDNSKEVREFLVSRRARVTPEQVGLPSGGKRRVAGLRRGEVAALADVSIEYYARIERGALAGASESVLDAVARALRLDEAEREHLFDLSRAANGQVVAVPRRKPKQWAARPGLQRALDAVTAGPAFVRNARMDLLALNDLGRAFYDEVLDGPGRGNLARYNFLDERSRVFYPEWDTAADISVSILRTEAGRDPGDKALQELIGELSTRSDEFRTRWGAHNVRRHGSGSKSFHHHLVGDLTLSYEGLELTSEPGLSFLIYTAEPGSASQESLQLLASWSATPAEEREPARPSGPRVVGQETAPEEVTKTAKEKH